MNQALLHDLPTWNLSDLYDSLIDPKIDQDISQAKQMVEDFCKAYQNKFDQDNWQAVELYQAITEYEKILTLLGKLISFSGLSYYGDLKDQIIQQFHQKIQELYTNLNAQMVFFTLNLNQISDGRLEQAYIKHKELKHYIPWLKQLRILKPYQLSHDIEKLFMEKNVTGRSAWVRLYDEILATLEFDLDDEKLPLAMVVDFLSHQDPKMRKKGASSLSDGLNSQINLLSKIFNVLAKDKKIEDSWRKMPSPMEERHIANQIESEVVEALYKTVKENYPALSHRYYKIKAKMLGKDTIEYWDRNAPLYDNNEKQFTWLEAQRLVYDAYCNFSPDLASLVKRFFDNQWIDAPVRAGKTSGAFAHPTIPSVHPYVLLNFRGKLRDVTTLAHELGHGAHQILSAPQGYLLADTPLTLAETASVFGEMLTFQSLLSKAETKQERKILLAAKIEDMLNTVVRQIAFYDFEMQFHALRKEKELSIAEVNQLWIKTQSDALGEAVNLDPIVGCFWSYISHFIHAPFYVYAYAFGDCLVNSLYSVYQKSPEGFAVKYLELLKSGGSKTYDELLTPFNLDEKNPNFWQEGLNMIIGFIDELEKII